jgi:hypothetical protein
MSLVDYGFSAVINSERAAHLHRLARRARHSGAAQRNPESSALVLVRLFDSFRSRSDRIGCISSLQCRRSRFRFRCAAPE